MNRKEAEEIIALVENAPPGVERFNKLADAGSRYRYAKGFMQGWDEMMKFEAERNGCPKDEEKK